MPLNLFCSNSSASYANIAVSKNCTKCRERNKGDVFTPLLSRVREGSSAKTLIPVADNTLKASARGIFFLQS
jgi:hypothetical protein